MPGNGARAEEAMRDLTEGYGQVVLPAGEWVEQKLLPAMPTASARPLEPSRRQSLIRGLRFRIAGS